MEVPGFHEAGDPMDQHRDMRLDIDHMSYEVSLLLALCVINYSFYGCLFRSLICFATLNGLTFAVVRNTLRF